MSRFKKIALAVLIGLVAQPSLVAKAADWPAWRGHNGNGISTDRSVNLKWDAKGPKKLWSAKVGSSYSSVSVKNGRLYTAGSSDGKDTVFCFDAVKGTPIWQKSFSHGLRKSPIDPNADATAATPVVDGDRVYVLGREGEAVCLKAKTGDIVWKKAVPAEKGAKLPWFGYSGSPVVDGKLVFYNVGDSGVALDKLSGDTVWNSGGGVSGNATPMLFENQGVKGVAFFHGSGIAGVDRNTGKKQWEHKWHTQYDVNSVDPVIVGDEVFITSDEKCQMLKFTSDRVTLLRESKILRSTMNTPVYLSGYMYGNAAGYLKCIDWQTGKEVWKSSGGFGQGSILLVGKTILALTENGTIVAAEATSVKYTEIARAKVMEDHCWTQPVLANGLFYGKNNEGDLICLDLRVK